MKLIYTFLFLSVCFEALGQTYFDSTLIRKSILKKSKKIPSYNASFHTEYFRSKYDNVFKNANDNELYELTNNSNPLIRRSALYNLIIQHSKNILNLLDKNSGDTTQYFFIMFGDLGTYETFLDELISFLMPLPNNFDEKFDFTISQKQKILTIFKRREKEKRNSYLLNH